MSGGDVGTIDMSGLPRETPGISPMSAASDIGLGANSITILEDQSYTLDFMTSSSLPGPVIVRSAGLPGTLTINGAEGSSLTFSPGDVLVWTPPQDAAGDSLGSVIFSVATGAGDVEVARITFNVTPVNDAPVSTADGDELSIKEDTAQVLGTEDFGFSDASDLVSNTGNALENVIITELPASGTLRLGDHVVTVEDIGGSGYVVSAADIADGNLSWTPDANDNGADRAELHFKLQDDGGTDNGGVDTSAEYVLKFDVTAVNDVPVLDFGAVSTAENKPLTLDVLASASDADGDTLTITSAKLASGFGSVAIDHGKLVYDPTDAPDPGLDKGQSEKVKITYAVSDGHGGTAEQTITVTVKGVSPDLFKGGSHADTLTGGADKDVIRGMGGNDHLAGGGGADVLTGGAGADTFIFADIGDSTVKAAGRDTITDFDRKQHDTIDLSAIDANGKGHGDPGFDFLGTHAFDGGAGELRYEILKGDTYVYADLNGDRKADFEIAFDGKVRLTEGDFAL